MLSAVCVMHWRNCCVSNCHIAGCGAICGGAWPSTAAGWLWPEPPNIEFAMPWPMTEPAIEPAIDEPIVAIIDGACGWP